MDYQSKLKREIVACQCHHRKIIPLCFSLKSLCFAIFIRLCFVILLCSSNVVLRSKWDAWTANAGIENEKAMLDFISTVDRLEKVSAPKEECVSEKSSPGPSMRKVNLKPGQTLTKQGTLYKQREYFKGWRPRQFDLIDSTLSYYIEAEDQNPRGTLALTGCTAVAAPTVIVDGVEYFPFLLTHKDSNRPYNLSALTKADADDWIEKINQAAELPRDQPIAKPSRRTTFTTSGKGTDIGGIGQNNSVDGSENASSAGGAPLSSVPFKATNNGVNAVGMSMAAAAAAATASALASADDGGTGTGAGAGAPSTPSTLGSIGGVNIIKPDASLKNIPAHLTSKVDSKMADLLDAFSPGSPGWEVFMDKEGVKGLKRPMQGGDLSAIRADAQLPFNVLDVFQTITSVECLAVMDPMRREMTKLKILSNHTWIEYLRFKEVRSSVQFN
jgi:hypothetical protein